MERGENTFTKIVNVLFKTISVALVLVLPAAVWVAAFEYDTQADTLSTISVTAPSAINFGMFFIGDNTRSSTTPGSVTITLGDDNCTGWSVTAKDVLTEGDYLGKMISGSYSLHSLLQISKDGVTYGDAYNGIAYTGSGTSGSLPFFAKQNIDGIEPAGIYSITIVFTGSVTY